MATAIYLGPKMRRERGIGSAPSHEAMARAAGVMSLRSVLIPEPKPAPLEVIHLPEEPNMTEDQVRELAGVALAAAELNEQELVDA